MPGSIAHHLLAVEAGIRLRENGSRLSPRAMGWGAQGPDFLFFHRIISPTPWRKDYRACGTDMHGIDPDRIFGAMRRYLNRQRGEFATAYTCGFLCHYALDRTAHPFINRQTETYRRQVNAALSSSVAHNLIEAQLDGILLRRMLRMNPRDYDPRWFLSDDPALLREQAALMLSVLRELYPARLFDAETVEQAYRDMRRVLGMIHDRSGHWRQIVAAAEKALHAPPGVSTLMRTASPVGSFDYANERRVPWIYLGDESRRSSESFFDLFARALDDALTLIDGFTRSLTEGEPAESLTGKLTFGTGTIYEETR